jgi:hypothetical protein
MEARKRIEEPLMLQPNPKGKDEMNLAEFPLCALAHRLPPEVKTLRFEDRKWDEGRDDYVTRQLTVTGSDAFGLPTALDDEVLLGLIQLSRQRGFSDRKVPFTRHELIHLLGWRDDSKSYHRLETSLNRWHGVTLYYNKAWWNKAGKCWVDANFHVLDNVWLCHRAEPPPDTGLPGTGMPLSAFVWNEVIFRSFQAGNLKSIDFQFFTSLSSAVAKRLYRFLDKRFHYGHRFHIDLRELCCEHIGLSRNYDTASMKRKLLSGIKELEQRGFLQPLTRKEQFQKVRSKKWEVVFKRTRAKMSPRRSTPKVESNSLLQALTERGITLSVANDLVRGYPPEHIQQQLEVFDWLMKRTDGRAPRRPPGFLTSSIQSEYDPPKDFLNDREARNRQRAAEQRAEARTSIRQAETEARDEQAEHFWSSLPEPERQRLENDALSHASNFHRHLLEGDGALAVAARQSLLDAYARKALQENASTPSELSIASGGFLSPKR